jgi:hypothetical protein
MRLINAADLTFKSVADLYFMIRQYSDKLNTMDASTYEYSVVRDSLEVIKRALAARLASERKFLQPKF